jgi:hypothetical protein
MNLNFVKIKGVDALGGIFNAAVSSIPGNAIDAQFNQVIAIRLV